jgi:Bacterial Ig-like domain (group 1)
VLRVSDAGGNAVANMRLRLLPAAGRTADSVLTTDSTGRAKTVWTLGRTAGLQRLTVRLESDTAGTEVTAVARAGKATKLSFVSPPESGRAGRSLPKPLVVQVTDDYGNPLGGQTVVFKPAGGSVVPARGLTDAAGRATVLWTLGPKAKRPELTGTVAGTGVSRTLTITARP